MSFDLTQFIFKFQDTGDYGDWVTPDLRSPIETSAFNGGKELVTLPDTEGTTRAPSAFVQGLMQASGNVTMSAYPVGFIEWVIRAILIDNVSTVSGTGFINDLLPDDSTNQLPWFSIQEVYNSTFARNSRGCVPTKWTLSVGAGAVVKSAFDFVVQDISQTGGFWSDGTTAAPGVAGGSTIASPMPRPYIFSNAQILTGDGISKVGNKLDITNPIAICTIDSFSFELDLAVEGKPAVCQGPPTSKRTENGLRKATLTFDNSWAVQNSTYWEIMQTGQTVYAQISLISPDVYDTGLPFEMITTLTRMQLASEGDGTPQLDGTKTSKMQSITMESFEDLATGVDLGITIKSSTDLG